MPKVYVAGALVATGGGFMAYHIGLLLQKHFGYEMVDLEVATVSEQLFRYETDIKTISVSEMESTITDEDILLVNPSYSAYMFGPRLPGKKIMYVQDYRTFNVLDCHFDLYVSVSNTVQQSLYGVYGLATPVIPAFIQLSRMPEVKPWHKRPEGSAIAYIKSPNREHRILVRSIIAAMKKNLPDVEPPTIMQGRDMAHGNFMKEIGAVRYFINISMAEGFGLVPLEAMALGTMVTGLDGLAGRDYMRSGKNCLVTSIRDLRILPELVCEAIANEKLAEQCVEGGYTTAMNYSHAHFRTAWLRELSKFLQAKPQHV